MATIQMDADKLKVAILEKMQKMQDKYKIRKAEYLEEETRTFNMLSTPFRWIGICKLRTVEDTKRILDAGKAWCGIDNDRWQTVYSLDVPNTYNYQDLKRFLNLCALGNPVTLTDKDVEIIF